MGGDKLWIELWGRPVWRWSLDALLAVPGMTRVAVVVPEGEVERFSAALPEHAFNRCLIVQGGAERADSTLAGIGALTSVGLPEDAPVLVHDAARPAASTALMERVLAAVTPTEGAIPTVALHDTLKRVDISGRVIADIDREGSSAAQTPQAATLVVLRAALEEAQAWGRKVTDEAGALAAGGVVVRAVAGDAENHKLTEPGDERLLRGALAAAALPIAAPPVAAAQRAGIGFDAHRYAPERTLHLGGIDFRGEPGLAGHSDGDVALHAVIDALLGAAGAGDIGTHFPSEDERWSGADSRELLTAAVKTLAETGWRPASIDLVIVASKPAIASRRDEIAAAIAASCGIDAAAVSVKGTTSDGLGFAGAEGIAAYAVAVIGPA